MVSEPRTRKKLRPRIIVQESGGVSSIERELLNQQLQREREFNEQLREKELALERAKSDAQLQAVQSQIDQLKEKVAQNNSAQTETQEKPGFNLMDKVGELLFEKTKAGDELSADRLVRLATGESLEEKDTSIVGMFGGLVSKAIENPQGFAQIAGIAVQAINSMRAPPPQPTAQPPQRPATTPQSQAAGASTPQPSAPPAPTFETEMNQMSGDMIAAMGRNAPVRSIAQRYMEVVNKFPAESAGAEMIMAQSAETVLAFLKAQLPQPEVQEVLNKESSLEWLRALLAEINRRREPEVQTVTPSANGNGQHVAAVAAQ